MALRNTFSSALRSTASRSLVAPTPTRSFVTTQARLENETELKNADPGLAKNSAGHVRYDWEDALRIETSLLTEDEVAIKSVDAWTAIPNGG